jgi:hypothetical protein
MLSFRMQLVLNVAVLEKSYTKRILYSIRNDEVDE